MEALLKFVVEHPWHFYTIFSLTCAVVMYCCEQFSPYEDKDKDFEE